MNGLADGHTSNYQFIPVMGPTFGADLLLFNAAGSQMFIALKVAAPIVAAIFIADALGFMARTVPQMNVFLIGIPLKILAGFIMLLVFLPFISGSWVLFSDF